MRAEPAPEQVDDAETGNGRVDGEVDGGTEPDGERADRIELHDLAVTLELPGRHGAAGEPAAQAGMAEQRARMRQPLAYLRENLGAGELVLPDDVLAERDTLGRGPAQD
jgi:hypothetical protein